MTHSPDAVGGPTDRPAESMSDSVDDGAADEHGSIRTHSLTAEWHVTRAADVTLVTVHVTNTHDTAREVRLENRLDGPVLPPCRHGVPEVGWSDDGLTRKVPGESRVSVGYACRAPPETPPVDVTDRPAAHTADGDATTPVDRALRSLGDHAPPQAVVSGEDGIGVAEDEHERAVEHEGGVETEREGETATEAVGATPGGASRSTPGPTEPTASAVDPAVSVPPNSSTDTESEPVPAPVAAWFDAVEARLTTADRLAGDVAEATPVVASLGGRPGVETLANAVDADTAALARVAARANELAARAEAVDVPDLGGPR